MKLKAFLLKYGIESITLNQWKADGSYMATVINPANGAELQLFTTKATGKKINGDSVITPINGKFYIGDVKTSLDSITVKA
jgi:uncharacterized protein (DUF2147 family)